MDGNRLTVDDTEKEGLDIIRYMKCSDQCSYAFNKASKVMVMIKRTIKYKEARIMVTRLLLEYRIVSERMESVLQET